MKSKTTLPNPGGDDSTRIVQILGVPWTIRFFSSEETDVFEKDGCDAYVLEGARVIVAERKKFDSNDRDLKELNEYDRKSDRTRANRVLRHEIIHAFLIESGLDASSLQNGDDGWATNEEMVDWFARMWPRIQAVYKELGIEGD